MRKRKAENEGEENRRKNQRTKEIPRPSFVLHIEHATQIPSRHVVSIIADYTDFLDQLMWRKVAVRCKDNHMLFHGGPAQREQKQPTDDQLCRRNNCECPRSTEAKARAYYSDPNPPKLQMYKRSSDEQLSRLFSTGPSIGDKEWRSHKGRLITFLVQPALQRGSHQQQRQFPLSDDYVYNNDQLDNVELIDMETSEVLFGKRDGDRWTRWSLDACGHNPRYDKQNQQIPCRTVMRMVFTFSFWSPKNWSIYFNSSGTYHTQCRDCMQQRDDHIETNGTYASTCNLQFRHLDNWLKDFGLDNSVETLRGMCFVSV